MNLLNSFQKKIFVLCRNLQLLLARSPTSVHFTLPKVCRLRPSMWLHVPLDYCGFFHGFFHDLLITSFPNILTYIYIYIYNNDKKAIPHLCCNSSFEMEGYITRWASHLSNHMGNMAVFWHHFWVASSTSCPRKFIRDIWAAAALPPEAGREILQSSHVKIISISYSSYLFHPFPINCCT